MRRLAPMLAVALVLALVFGGLLTVGTSAQGARQQFGWIVAKRLTVDTTSSLVGDVAAGGNLGVAGTTTAGSWLAFGVQPTAVVAMNGALTPTGSYQPISATASVGISVVVAPAAGTFLRIVNVGAQTVTLTDTGTLKLAGNAVLSTTDSLSLVSDGANLIELARSDN